MRVLLTGGAGYIGSHVAVALIESGHEPLIVDNAAATGAVADRLAKLTGRSIPTLTSDIRDVDAVRAFLHAQGGADAVIHLAGLKSVSESVARPAHYYDVNISTSLAVLNLMASENISKIVFSSSATVYGDPDRLPVTEDQPTSIDLPNPYGKTKRIVEEILRDAAAADARISVIILRYFNPVGAHPSGLIGEHPDGVPSNLMPYVARVASGQLSHVGIFGDDYPTPDGTGLRDYIHVLDLADGHVAALEHAQPGAHTYNLGTGKPVSVAELIDAFSHATGREIPTRIMPRRPGDVAASYCDAGKAERDWGWRATRSVDLASEDFWRWQLNNPNGYVSPPGRIGDSDAEDMGASN